MVLAIDIGNSNIVLGCITEGKIVCICRMATDKQKTSDEYGFEIKNLLLMHEVELGHLKGCIISSVVPSLTEAISQGVKLALKVHPLIVGPGIKTGLNIKMDNPAQVGADLVVEAVGCIQKYPLPLIIIDLGTATTVSVINQRREYIGGCICPGINLSLTALAQSTAQLPDISLELPKHVIGTNTIDSMRSGVIFGMTSMLEGLIDRIESELGTTANVVLTGGMASVIAPVCKRTMILDEDLVLDGLYYLYQKNTTPQKKETHHDI